MSSYIAEGSAAGPRKPLNLPRLLALREQGERIAMLTAYDASFAQAADAAGVDTLLVGDSLGNVVQGQSSTLPVTLEHMAYHTACVARAKPSAWLIADMPFGSYEAGCEQAMASAVTLMRAGAQMVKLEGGGWTAEIIHFLVERGVPVCAHLGLTPQRVHTLGGYRVQGRDERAAEALKRETREVHEAGAAMLVLELVPSKLAREITDAHAPLITIGIGAGAGTSGQVLVLHDMLGLGQGKRPRFVRDFMAEGGSIGQALARYVAAVKDGSFPDETVHGY
jgi:3-methyl-2-oxobutanoate hydroxymethyltransferase